MKRPSPAEIGGLHLSVLRGPNDDGLWYWRARDAERKTVWTGWASRADAIRALRELAGEPEPPPTLVTVEDLLRVWVAERARDPALSPVTKHNYNKLSASPIRWLGALPLTKLDQAALEGFRNARLGEGRSPRTVRHELKVVRLAWRWAIGRELVQGAVLPFVRVKLRGYVQNHRTPTEAEVAEVLGHMSGEAQLGAQVLAVTGARLSEALSLRRCDVDLDRGRLHVVGKVGKRTIPLTPGLRRLLQGRADATTERLLVTFDHALRIAVRAACAKAGVPHFTLHAIRRMAVDRLNRAGVDAKVAAAVTGHSVEVMLSVYRSVSAEDKAKGVRQAGLGQRMVAKGEAGQPASGAQAGAQCE